MKKRTHILLFRMRLVRVRAWQRDVCMLLNRDVQIAEPKTYSTHDTSSTKISCMFNCVLKIVASTVRDVSINRRFWKLKAPLRNQELRESAGKIFGVEYKCPATDLVFYSGILSHRLLEADILFLLNDNKNLHRHSALIVLACVAVLERL